MCTPEFDTIILDGVWIVQMLSPKTAKTFQEYINLISFRKSATFWLLFVFVHSAQEYFTYMDDILKLQHKWVLFGMCTRTTVSRHQPERGGVVNLGGWTYRLPNCLATGRASCGTMIYLSVHCKEPLWETIWGRETTRCYDCNKIQYCQHKAKDILQRSR
jgi:hypothetical protein